MVRTQCYGSWAVLELPACASSGAQAEEKKQGSLVQEVIEVPERGATVAMRHGTYDKLDAGRHRPAGHARLRRGRHHRQGGAPAACSALW